MNSEYQTKKNAEGSQGEYKRIYEEYDEGEQSHVNSRGVKKAQKKGKRVKSRSP